METVIPFLIAVACIFAALFLVDVATVLWYRKTDLRSARAYRETQANPTNVVPFNRADVPFDQEKE